MKFFDKEKKEKNRYEYEKKERIPHSGLKDLFVHVAATVKNFLLTPFSESGKGEKELFETQFDPRKYIELYYPPIEEKPVKQISDILARIETRKKETDVEVTKIDGEALESQLDTGASIELIENYCIYDFIARKALPAMLAKQPDDHFTVLDVGGGPTIYQHIPLLGVSRRITHAEYLDANRHEVMRWKQGVGYDWSTYISCWQSYLTLHPEAYSMATDDVQETLRALSTSDSKQYHEQMIECVKDVIPVDVFNPNIIFGQEGYDAVSVGKWGSVDLLTSHFCIESATADADKWKAGIGNIAKKVNEDGFLLMTAIRNAEWYKVGDNKLPAVPVDYEVIAKELEPHGFKVLTASELLTHNQQEVGYDGMVFILAQKQ